jgi:hypothetical protein
MKELILCYVVSVVQFCGNVRVRTDETGQTVKQSEEVRWK